MTEYSKRVEKALAEYAENSSVPALEIAKKHQIKVMDLHKAYAASRVRHEHK